MAGEFDTPYRGGFVGRTHHFACRVYFEDTDTAGHVYHANYLRFIERARSDMMRALGVDQRAALQEGEGAYAVAEVTIRYHGPAWLDDDLQILSTLETLRAASCTIHQRVMRGPERLAEATVTAVFLSPDGRPRRHPPAWVERFRALEEENRVCR